MKTDGSGWRDAARRLAIVVAMTMTAAIAQAQLGTDAASAATTTITCSVPNLVSAITTANAQNGTVRLAPGCRYTLTAADNSTDGGTGLPVITQSVTVVGNGATISRWSAPATPAFRIFEVASGATLVLSNLTLGNGLADDGVNGGGAIDSHGLLGVSGVTFSGNAAPAHTGPSGGAIQSAGPLTVTGSSFTNNTAQEGGAIFAQGTTTIRSSTFAANTATDFGGGALVSAVGTMTISASAFVNNIAVDTPGHSVGGGAIDNDSVVNISDSTFVGNRGGSNGGGAIQNFGTANIIRSTLSGNDAPNGASIHTFAATPPGATPVVTTVAQSIVADGTTGSNCSGNVTVTDGGYNLDTAASCGFTAANHSLNDTPAQLGPLADNGGPTPTMSLTPGSAAIDAIPADVSGCTGRSDQRGVPRPQGARCDIGAYELIHAAGTLVPLTPSRLLDSRSGVGASGPVAAGATVHLDVTAAGVPAGVSAVVLNVTATGPLASGYVTVYPGGTAMPGTSSLNFVRGQTVANLVVVAVGADGVVNLTNASSGSVQLVADISGYYLGGAPTVPGALQALRPSRLLDTRSGVGGSGPVAAGATVHLDVTAAGVPAGVSAVVLNVTATGPSASGYVTVYPGGTAMPGTSSLNFVGGQTVANLVVVAVGADGVVNLTNASSGSVQLVADISGYYLGGAPTVPGALQALRPSRLLDTRSGVGGSGPVAAGATVHLDVTAAGVPAGVSAVVLNVTATGPLASGYVTVYPGGTAMPGTSSLNFVRGQTVANLVVVAVGADGVVNLTNASSGSVQLVADISGYHLR